MTNFIESNRLDYIGCCIRPPSEANSILIQTTLGCSHNKCTFCGSYQNKRFTIKDQAIIKCDLLFAQKHCRNQKRVFIMDGDSLIMPMKRWEWLLKQIKNYLPWVHRVGTYANAKGIALKSNNNLNQLQKLGLGIIYYGIESGHPLVLKKINKGSNPEKLIREGQRIKAAGIKLSVTVLLGISGPSITGKEHAKATGQLLSAINPDFVGALSLMIIPNTILGNKVLNGQFELPNAQAILIELKEMITHTNLSEGLFYANHASNYLPIKAKLPQDRTYTINLINQALDGKIRLKPEWTRAL